MFITISFIVACRPSAGDLAAIDYAPLPGDEWQLSTPEEQGVAPEPVAELYYKAAKLETLYGLLVVKNDQLIAEKYFNDGSVSQKNLLQSATKSYISALVSFGLLYLNDGLYEGNQVVSADWVRDSLQIYSEDPFVLDDASRHIDPIDYGYPVGGSLGAAFARPPKKTTSR